MFYCCGITNKGNRDHNEDALMIHKAYITEGTLEEHIPSPFIAAVADGVAGEQAGELASSLCLRLLSNIKYNHTTDLKERINDVHEVLVQYGLENGAYLNMQTTLCGVAIDENDRITTFNVGDSRLYRYRNAMIRQLSRDQSLVQLLYEKGTITSEEKRTHAQKNIIFPVLGNVHNAPQIDIRSYGEKMQYGDVFLICSDGLSDYVSSTEMEEILSLPKSMAKRLRMMSDLSLEKGSKDNISIIAISYYDDK
ncbi:MAG: serine/threonine-protein phosphatase [Oscillospiraceae bacterium]|nr:protein phosphatase 2C domain-containing protein [Oscillospiraceae bacterium]MDD6085027.1 serine/threonine-protein phosphatase [Oscillospiraceae bacterium]MDY3257936.1 PP2C family serine/threonine-protein phosphatase [Ruminococcus callidus]